MAKLANLTRRGILGAGIFASANALAQQTKPIFGTSPSVVSQPPRRWGRLDPTTIYPDPDIITVDKSFDQYLVGGAVIHRVATGFQWCEGPAWSGEGQYVVFSDVKGDAQYRYIWETGEINPFRRPSYNSNGNSFDFEGRQLSTQGFLRRVVRWELDGSIKVIADTFEGKGLNSPNDLIAHPDGSIWFTDPTGGVSLNEGHPDSEGAPANTEGLFDPKLGSPGLGLIGSTKRELLANTYRWDPSAGLENVVPNNQASTPNGLCFSPDYRTFYLISGGKILAFDVGAGKVSNMRVLTDCVVDGVHCRPDGMRADRAGNIWAGSNAPLGYAGVIVWNSTGKLIGRIRLPEVCPNVCFAGPKRDYLFMCATQSIYLLRVNIQGAAPG